MERVVKPAILEHDCVLQAVAAGIDLSKLDIDSLISPEQRQNIMDSIMNPPSSRGAGEKQSGPAAVQALMRPMHLCIELLLQIPGIGLKHVLSGLASYSLISGSTPSDCRLSSNQHRPKTDAVAYIS